MPYNPLAQITTATSEYKAGQILLTSQLNRDLNTILSDIKTKLSQASSTLVPEKLGSDVSVFEAVGNSTTVTQRGCAYTTAGPIAVNVANTNQQTLRRRIIWRTGAVIGNQAGVHYPAAQYDPNYYTEFHTTVSDATAATTSRMWVGFTNTVSQVPNTAMGAITGSAAAIVTDVTQTTLFFKYGNGTVTPVAIDTTAPRSLLTTGAYIRIILNPYTAFVSWTIKDLTLGTVYSGGRYDSYPNQLLLPRVSVVTNAAVAADLGTACVCVIRPALDEPCGVGLTL